MSTLFGLDGDETTNCRDGSSCGIRIGTTKFMKWTTVVVYIVIAVLLFIAIKAEWLDVYCPSQKYSSDSCGEGCGMAYIGSDPDPNATFSETLDKIDNAAKADQRTVKWRRALILSVIIVLCIFIFVLGRLPNGIELFICVVISEFFIWGSFSFYTFHHTDHAKNRINQNTEHLREMNGILKRD